MPRPVKSFLRSLITMASVPLMEAGMASTSSLTSTGAVLRLVGGGAEPGNQ